LNVTDSSPEQSETEHPLGVIISLLRPQAVLSKIICGAGRWSSRFARSQDPAFGLVLEGSCFLDVDDVGMFELHAGDFVLLPETPGFTMSSDPAISPSLTPPVHTAVVRHGSTSGPPTLRMLGGWFKFDPANAPLLLTLLPVAIHVRRDDAGAARLRRVVELICGETNDERPGSDLILQRLVEVLMIEALRVHSPAVDKKENGLLAGLADPALARALRAMHSKVAGRWTVAELARIACMSRAVFAERFAQAVGMPPMEYLLECRMAIAKDLLRRRTMSHAEIAQTIGYQSASAFSTAFTRLTGSSPSTFAAGVRTNRG
jgi:AraC-like DNA-binding protein